MSKKATESLKSSIVEVLQELFEGPEREKVAPAAYVMVVDGQTIKEKPGTKKDLIKSIQAITLRKPEAVIEVYTYAGEVSVRLPMTGDVLTSKKGV